jgi:hypothetical protein
LIVIFQRGIVLKLNDRRKLNAMAFKLDRDTHLLAGIASSDIAVATAKSAQSSRIALYAIVACATSDTLVRATHTAKSWSVSIR